MELDATMPAARETFADFDDCFRTLFPRVARTASLVARDPDLGADIAQEAFARLYERWDRMASADHMRNFAFRVAINLAHSHLRRRAAAPFGLSGPERQMADPNEPTAGWLDAVEALGSLSGRQRACVVLADYEDLDAETIGQVLGMRASTARVHLLRGRRALRARLGLPETPPESIPDGQRQGDKP